MKKLLIILSIPVLIMLGSSCNKDAGDPNFSETLMEGHWKVAQFYHIDRDETWNYQGYKITFAVENTVTAVGVNFFAGEWHISTNDGLQLSMDFKKTLHFEKFNAKWDVVNYSVNVIEMELVNESLGATDHLVLIRM